MNAFERVAALLGTPVAASRQLSGGDICAAHRVELADGPTVFVKTHPDPPSDFFRAEAQGLRWLAAADAVPVPDVLGHDEGTLILEWIEEGTPSRDAAAVFGRRLARLHRSDVGAGTAMEAAAQATGGSESTSSDGSAPSGGSTPAPGTTAVFGANHAGFAGVLPLDNTAAADWPTFYVDRRIAPLLARARELSAVSGEDAAAIGEVAERMGELTGPAERPARLHGDLWAGNLLWSRDGVVRLIDPAAYAGHREIDLAMLHLFGAPWLESILDEYNREYPLAAGWQHRVPLYQLLPLLVHAILFGGGYGSQAGQAARRALSAGTART